MSYDAYRRALEILYNAVLTTPLQSQLLTSHVCFESRCVIDAVHHLIENSLIVSMYERRLRKKLVDW
jgi:hypothetical protein